WNTQEFDDSAWPITGQTGIGYDTLAGAGGYDPLVRTDVEAQMLGAGKNTSAFIRLPFEIDGPNDFSSLTLRIAYDDGFVAYINGQKVAWRNDPTTPAWNSPSNGTVSKNSAMVTIDITA